MTVDFKAGEPRFFSFMMTDANGLNSFFHALIFHEEINEAEIDSEDFDIINKVIVKRREIDIKKRKITLLDSTKKATVCEVLPLLLRNIYSPKQRIRTQRSLKARRTCKSNCLQSWNRNFKTRDKRVRRQRISD